MILDKAYNALRRADSYLARHPVQAGVLIGAAAFGLTALLVPDVRHSLSSAYDYVIQINVAHEQRLQECMAAQAEKGLSGALAESNCGVAQVS